MFICTIGTRYSDIVRKRKSHWIYKYLYYVCVFRCQLLLLLWLLTMLVHGPNQQAKPLWLNDWWYCDDFLSPALLMRRGYCVELSTSSSSCSSMTLHCRRYGVSLTGFRMRVSLWRTPSTRSHSSSQRSSVQAADRASPGAMSTSSIQTVTPERDQILVSSRNLSQKSRVRKMKQCPGKNCTLEQMKE